MINEWAILQIRPTANCQVAAKAVILKLGSVKHFQEIWNSL